MKENKFITSVFPFLSWLKLIDTSTLKSDLIAGITNSFVVLPQGVAFAMIAGLPPEYGLYTAMIPPIIAALFGSSYHLISGPTTAISIVMYSTISPYAAAGTEKFIMLAIAITFMVGVVQLILGIAGIGVIVNFISHTVVIGFTAGAAMLIATSQIKYTLGLSLPNGESFFHTWLNIFKDITNVNLYIFFVAAVTLATIIILKILRPGWPGMLLAMIVGSLTAFFIGSEEHGITLLTRIHASLPPFSSPEFSLKILGDMSSGVIAVAMLGLIEAVSIARAIALKSKQRLDSNREFIGQGLSNIVGSFFSCFASSGSFTRSGINYSAGAKTPLAAVFAAIFLAIIVLVAAPLSAYLPISVMGGIVLYVAYKLIDINAIKSVLRTSRSESAIMIVTFLATIFMKLEFAIYVGIILSLMFYLNQTSKPRIITRVPNPLSPKRKFITKADMPKCPQFEIIRLDGSLFFGSVNHVEQYMRILQEKSPEKIHILIICSGINFIDLAGAEMLINEVRRYRKKGGGLYFYKIKSTVYSVLKKGGYLDEIGEANIFNSKNSALTKILGKLNVNLCSICDERVFWECEKMKSIQTTLK